MRISFKFAALALTLGLTAAWGAEPVSADSMVRLNPYNVSAVFSTIQVRFVLSRQNLFNPQTDPIAEARVTVVGALPNPDETDLQSQDILIGLNGTPLAGLTLQQLAAIVRQARADGNLVWAVRRGFETMEILHNGDWLTPLPGLTR